MRLPPGLGSVHMIGDGKNRRNPWRARVESHVELDENSGKAKKKYITIGYYPTETDAIEALIQYRKNPYTMEAATCTFADVFEMWKAKKYPEISISGQRGYNAAFANSAPLHKMKMREIRTSHLEGIMFSLKLGYQVQSRLKTFWGQIFKYAIEHDIIQKNYSDFVKTKDKDPGTTRTDIPAEDREKIWHAIDQGDHDAEIAMIYCYTGMRPTELLLVEKANVDLRSRIIIGGLKTDAGQDRHIPIHPCIMPFIERLMQTDGDLLIMRYDTGKPTEMTYNRFREYHWKPLMVRLGMEHYTPHYGRHTCATMMRTAGVEEDIRKLILGHANGDITDRYTHHPDIMLIKAMDSVPGRNTECISTEYDRILQVI
jgi:integrase